MKPKNPRATTARVTNTIAFASIVVCRSAGWGTIELPSLYFSLLQALKIGGGGGGGGIVLVQQFLNA